MTALFVIKTVHSTTDRSTYLLIDYIFIICILKCWHPLMNWNFSRSGHLCTPWCNQVPESGPGTQEVLS